jgi:anthranilate phosphoribosyltransferase
MRHVAPIRSELGFRTVFNLVGPLTNPANADGQVMGLYDARRVESIASVLLSLGVRHAFVVAGADGLDEISLSGPTHVAEAHNNTVRCYDIAPGEFGLSTAPVSALSGGTATDNARLLQEVLSGKPGPHRDIVVLNVAPALVAGGGAQTLAEGVERAVESIDSGAAAQKLADLQRASNA